VSVLTTRHTLAPPVHPVRARTSDPP
jgi:hypothetical protein